MTILVKFAALAAVLLLASHATPSNAATLSPGAMAPRAGGALVEQVNWVCGPIHCIWRPNYRGPVRVYTRNWGPPRARGCIWVRGPLFAWRHVCP